MKRVILNFDKFEKMTGCSKDHIGTSDASILAHSTSPIYLDETTGQIYAAVISTDLFNTFYGDVIEDSCEDYKQAILDELSEKPAHLVQLAYLYANNFQNYGVDVTKVWDTAVQQSSNLAAAKQCGYYQGVAACTDKLQKISEIIGSVIYYHPGHNISDKEAITKISEVLADE